MKLLRGFLITSLIMSMSRGPSILASAKKYKSLSMEEIVDEMKSLASLYPQLVTYTTAQEKYNLPSTCIGEDHVGCYNHILIISDSKIYASKKAARKARRERPDVFLSGALHGNERVGPVAMIEVAKLLVTAASCQSDLVVDVDGFNVCEEEWYSKYDEQQVAWLARLVSTRRIVIVPAANSNGYYLNSRNEGSVDPNRDFPFDQRAEDENGVSGNCMRTIAARTINELFLDHLFQMSVTYHGGMEAIVYEWGATSIPRLKVSPDYFAEDAIAVGLSQFAGELAPNELYQTGDMNSIVYSVRGGFEDWAYAGSWKTDMVNQCNPTTYGGYDLNKTLYDDSTLRTFNILVETSDSKNPDDEDLGTDEGLLTGPFEFDSNADNGHVSKHIRTALMAIDIVEPYIEIVQYRNRKLPPELKPLSRLYKRWSKWKKKVRGKSFSQPRIGWTIGGSFNVQDTFLVYGRWDDFPLFFNSINQLKQSQIDAVLQDNTGKFLRTDSQSGGTRWSNDSIGEEEKFQDKVVLSSFSRGDKVAIFAFVKVDQKWADQPDNFWPSVDVQSHMANGRTNRDYFSKKHKKGRIVRGRLHWISVPLTINIRA